MPASQIYQASVTLNNDQIKALPTTSIEIVPAPGTDHALIFHSGLYVVHLEQIYTNVDNSAYMNLQHVHAGPRLTNIAMLGDSNLFNADVGDYAGWMTTVLSQNYIPILAFPVVESVGYNMANIINKPFLLGADNNSQGDFTGGHANNTLQVIVFYAIPDIS